MTLTIEETKEIAEGLYPSRQIKLSYSKVLFVTDKLAPIFPMTASDWHLFDPLRDADNHKVLMALVELCNESDFTTVNSKHEFSCHGCGSVPAFWFREFNNESIARAYLAVLRGKQ